MAGLLDLRRTALIPGSSPEVRQLADWGESHASEMIREPAQGRRKRPGPENKHRGAAVPDVLPLGRGDAGHRPDAAGGRPARHHRRAGAPEPRRIPHAIDALAPFKRILDVYTSRWFGNPDGKLSSAGSCSSCGTREHSPWLKDPSEICLPPCLVTVKSRKSLHQGCARKALLPLGAGVPRSILWTLAKSALRKL